MKRGETRLQWRIHPAGDDRILFETTKRARDIHAHVSRFTDEHVFPNETLAAHQIAEGDRWQPVPIIESLKAKAQGLWNLFRPESE